MGNRGRLAEVISIVLAIIVSIFIGLLVSRCLFDEEPVDALEEESASKVTEAVANKGARGSIEVKWHLEDGKIVLDTHGILTATLRTKLKELNYHPAIVSYKNKGLWPVPGRKYVSSAFGIRRGRLHSGIDIPARRGYPVIASESGIVIFAGNSRSGYGKLVAVVNLETGYLFFYAHLSRVGVEVGDFIDRGAYIGAVGNTGRSFGSHLHFEIRTSLLTPIDPLEYLKKPGNLIVRGLN